MTPKEEELLRDMGQYISITPESEMHYGHTHPRAYEVSSLYVAKKLYRDDYYR